MLVFYILFGDNACIFLNNTLQFSFLFYLSMLCDHFLLQSLLFSVFSPFNVRNNLQLVLCITDFIFHSVNSVILFLTSSLFGCCIIYHVTFFSFLMKELFLFDCIFLTIYPPTPSSSSTHPPPSHNHHTAVSLSFFSLFSYLFFDLIKLPFILLIYPVPSFPESIAIPFLSFIIA